MPIGYDDAAHSIGEVMDAHLISCERFDGREELPSVTVCR